MDEDMNNIPVRPEFYTEKTILEPLEDLRAARQDAPVFLTRDESGQEIYVVARYDLIREIFSKPEDFSNDYANILRPKNASAEANAILARTGFDYEKHGSFLLTADGAYHKRLRALVAPAFTIGRINRLSDAMSHDADALIDNFIERGEADVFADFAAPFTLGSILRVIGLDSSLINRAVGWSTAAALRVSRRVTREQELESSHELADMITFLQAHVRAIRANPGDDLASSVITARAEGQDPLSDEEAVSFLHEMLFAGNETTRATIVAGVALLLRHPEQLALLRSDASLMPNAVEEILRHHSTGAAIWRIAARDTKIGGVAIPKGAVINLRMDSANRDESTFTDADKFDIRRSNANINLTFGYGLHHCVGNLLARRETAIALTKFLGRLEDMRLVEDRCDLRREQHVLAHILRAVHIAFRPGRRLKS